MISGFLPLRRKRTFGAEMMSTSDFVIPVKAGISAKKIYIQ